MPGYQTKQERVAIAGAGDLIIRSLRDRLQYVDPLGAAERQGISSAMWPLFGLLWPSAAHLASRLAARPVRANERILEIGCGLALASLAAHRHGADVTASDCHPLAGAFLAENARLNHLSPLTYRHGEWADHDLPEDDDPVAAGTHVQGRFELIVGSDLLYERDASGILAGFIGRHAQAAAEVWIADPDRGNRPAFNRRMDALGFARREERLDCAAGAGRPAYKGRLLIFTREAAGPASAPARTSAAD